MNPAVPVPVSDIPLVPLPSQPDGVPWPTAEWPTGDPVGADTATLGTIVDEVFADEPPEDLGTTRALLVVQHGRIVLEHYGPGVTNLFTNEHEDDGPQIALISWSMAKSMLQIALGIARRDHAIDLDAPIPVPEWSDPGDPRAAITWNHLLHMASGLGWREEYSPDRGSDVIAMLFGDGKADMAAFAAGFELEAAPGTRFLYSSGTTNILTRALQSELGLAGDTDGMSAWLDEHLFAPIGMTSAYGYFDAAGTWTASSYVYATARDFARFGLLALRGGTWDGTTIVDPDWIDTARRPITLPTDGHANGYGSHWWVVDDGLGTFGAQGFEGQRITCVPARDLVVVRLGRTLLDPDADPDAPTPVDVLVQRIINCFPT